MRLKAWHYSILLLGVCAVVVGALEWHRWRQEYSGEALSRRLPDPRNGFKAYVDTRSLRISGFLDMILGSKAAEDLEYRRFVDEVAFDYREDLDAVVALFDGSSSYFLLRGRFEWPRIREYAESQGAACRDGHCYWESQTPGSVLSFCPVSGSVLSVAVSPNVWAAQGARTLRPAPAGYYVPPDPFWIAAPGTALEGASTLPPGASSVTSALRGALRVTIGVGGAGGALRAEMRAAFPDKAAARASLDRLNELTDTLRKFLARAGSVPNPRDLSGVLAGGSFEAQSASVIGRWPLRREFLTALSEGQI